MIRRLLSLFLVCSFLLAFCAPVFAETLSVCISSCTVPDGGTCSMGDTVVFQIGSTGAVRTQLLIVPPDSSRMGQDGPVCSVTLDMPGIWAFVAYAQDSTKKTVHSDQWRIHVEGSTGTALPFLTDEERYINHFFTEDFRLHSDEGKKLIRWLDSSEKSDISDRTNSGYLLLDEEMVHQDQFWSKVGAGYIAGAELALDTISNFGLNLLLDLVNHQSWKQVFPENGWYAVPYYQMLSNTYADYMQTVNTLLTGFEESSELILSAFAGVTEDTLGLVNASTAEDLRKAAEALKIFADKHAGTPAALAMAYRLVTTKFGIVTKDWGLDVEAIPPGAFKQAVEDKVVSMLRTMQDKLQKLPGEVDQTAQYAVDHEKQFSTGSTVFGALKVSMKWMEFARDLKNHTDAQNFLMYCFLQATLDQIGALETWRNDLPRYSQKTEPLEEALDLLTAQMMQTAYSCLQDVDQGITPEAIARKLSVRSFADALSDTLNFAGTQIVGRYIRPGGLIPTSVMNVKAVTGVGAFVLHLMDSCAGYTEWRDTVKHMYEIKRSLSDSVTYQLEAYRSDPCYSRAVTLIESLELLKFLKQAGEKTVMLNFLGNTFSDLSPAGLSVLLCEMLRDNDLTLVYPQAEFRKIEVVEYRDTQAVANSAPLPSNARIMGYYSNTPGSFMGNDLLPCPDVYRNFCMETSNPSSMSGITSIDSVWVHDDELPNLDLAAVQRNHQQIRKYMPKVTDFLYNSKTDLVFPIETYDYDESLFTGDSGYFKELVHGEVYAYVHPEIAITLTHREHSTYLEREKEIREKLTAYQSTISHSDKEAKKHQLEERWIWTNVTSAYINSVEMFDQWILHN